MLGHSCRHTHDAGQLGRPQRPQPGHLPRPCDDPDRADDGSLLVDDDYLVLVNAWWEPLAFTIPATRSGQQWQTESDTFEPTAPFSLLMHGTVTVGPRSIVVLRASLAS